jgi:hypothetical protein
MPPAPIALDRPALERAFMRLGEIAANAGKQIDISVYGGSALVLSTDFRVSTQDVDAVFEQDRTFVRHAAQLIADEFGWEENWINDGVKGFLSAHDSDPDAKCLFRSYPSEVGPGLRVFVATPAYLFAMKSLAMRAVGAERRADIEDIRKLGALMGITSASDAISVVTRYYSAARLSPKTRFGLEDVFGAEQRDT